MWSDPPFAKVGRWLWSNSWTWKILAWLDRPPHEQDWVLEPQLDEENTGLLFERPRNHQLVSVSETFNIGQYLAITMLWCHERRLASAPGVKMFSEVFLRYDDRNSQRWSLIPYILARNQNFGDGFQSNFHQGVSFGHSVRCALAAR